MLVKSYSSYLSLLVDQVTQRDKCVRNQRSFVYMVSYIAPTRGSSCMCNWSLCIYNTKSVSSSHPH